MITTPSKYTHVLGLLQNYDTLSKGKKSWSVRLGLSRQSHSPEESVKGWGTISSGSALSRQMIYGDPWLYGTVRSTRPGHDPRGFLTPSPHHGAPVLVVCSCPEFLSGTTRKLGNCRKCGGHRLAGIPIGGTCRMPTTSSRARPSLAGSCSQVHSLVVSVHIHVLDTIINESLGLWLIHWVHMTTSIRSSNTRSWTSSFQTIHSDKIHCTHLTMRKFKFTQSSWPE